MSVPKSECQGAPGGPKAGKLKKGYKYNKNGTCSKAKGAAKKSRKGKKRAKKAAARKAVNVIVRATYAGKKKECYGKRIGKRKTPVMYCRNAA